MDKQIIPLKGIRGIIAKRMTESSNTKPRVTLHKKIRMDPLLSAMKELAVQAPDQKLSINDVLIKVVALTLREYPRINGFIDQEKVTIADSVNIGVAVAMKDGLVVPVIPSADEKHLFAIRDEVRVKAERARSGKLKPDDISNGTFTITNLGMYGIHQFTPIINMPEMAILGINAIEEIIVDVDFAQQKVIRGSYMTFSLSFDHAAIDGADAAEFLGRLENRIQQMSSDIESLV